MLDTFIREQHPARTARVKRWIMAFLGTAMIVMVSSCTVPPLVEAEPSRIILNPTADPATSQTVTWRSVGVTADADASAEIRDGNGHATIVEATVREQRYIGTHPAVSFSATFEGLSPNADYSYRVNTENNTSDWHQFTTASSTDDPFTFTWYADAQEDLIDDWTPIVALTSRAFPTSAMTLQSGDLVENSVEADWGDWFSITDGQRQNENWLPAVGNHEYDGDSLGTYWHANFTLPSNGPATRGTDANVHHRELIASHLDNRAYFVDYQGVRFITLSSEIVDQDDLEAAQDIDLFDVDDDAWPELYLDVQADWLAQTLASSQANWNIVQVHHPIFSVSSGRDNPAVRDAFLPVLQQHDVDLVLSGHDHTYSRGVLTEDRPDEDAPSDSIVFAVSNSGPKYYELGNDEMHDWSHMHHQVIQHEEVSVTAGIRVTAETLEYEAIAVQQGAESTFDGEIGETVDAFTVIKNDDGTIHVTEGVNERVATGL